jgi:hypothetical protein
MSIILFFLFHSDHFLKNFSDNTSVAGFLKGNGYDLSPSDIALK